MIAYSVFSNVYLQRETRIIPHTPPTSGVCNLINKQEYSDSLAIAINIAVAFVEKKIFFNKIELDMCSLKRKYYLIDGERF